jgi:hypothetical protein
MSQALLDVLAVNLCRYHQLLSSLQHILHPWCVAQDLILQRLWPGEGFRGRAFWPKREAMSAVQSQV